MNYMILITTVIISDIGAITDMSHWISTGLVLHPTSRVISSVQPQAGRDCSNKPFAACFALAKGKSHE